MRKTRRTGRPAEFRDRVRLTVFLERRELAAVQERAKAVRLSASAFTRRLLLGATGKRKEP